MGFTIMVVVVIVAFGLLSLWQWQRAEEKKAQRLALELAVSAAPVTIDAAEAGPPGAFHAVRVTGTYDVGVQAAVRKRPLNAQNGFWVMTPLVDDRGTAVWVNRGWIAVGGDALSTPDLPAPPAGLVTVTGYLRPYEDARAEDNTGLPAGQIAAISPLTLPSLSADPGGYVQLVESQPGQEGLVPVPLPDVDEGRNISYAVQWLLFAAVAIGGWYYFLRREAGEDGLLPSGTTTTQED